MSTWFLQADLLKTIDKRKAQLLLLKNEHRLRTTVSLFIEMLLNLIFIVHIGNVTLIKLSNDT